MGCGNVPSAGRTWNNFGCRPGRSTASPLLGLLSSSARKPKRMKAITSAPSARTAGHPHSDLALTASVPSYGAPSQSPPKRCRGFCTSPEIEAGNARLRIWGSGVRIRSSSAIPDCNPIIPFRDMAEGLLPCPNLHGKIPFRDDLRINGFG
jgi:hypothetical protein